MAIVLFDNANRRSLYPLNRTKAIADLRWGILKIKEWWQTYFADEKVYVQAEKYLKNLYTAIPFEEHIWIDATILPTDELIEKIKGLSINNALADSNGLIAGKMRIDANEFDKKNLPQYFESVTEISPVKRLKEVFEMFQWNADIIKQQFLQITKGRVSEPISKTNTVIHPENIFIEEGASVEYSMLNATEGPIYIGKNALIMEGCLIKGALALCENAVLKLGTKIYGATTIGIKSVGGGEIKNSIISDYSNKGHDGYLGDSVIGEWCNLGAGTTNSNIKNSAGSVMLWNYRINNYIDAGIKCGVIMGDYTRVAINSCINTGTSIGVCCNVFGNGLLPTIIQDFTWGAGAQSMVIYRFPKAISDINNWKKLKGFELTGEEFNILKHIFEKTMP